MSHEVMPVSIVRAAYILLAVLFSLVWWPAEAGCQPVKTDILVLHSYSPDYVWTQSEQQGIDEVFAPLQDKYRLRIEYMDSGYSPGVLRSPLLPALYKEKFFNSRFGAIIATDNGALDFLIKHRDGIFPGVPVIFCGINGYDESFPNLPPMMTGVVEDNDFLGLFNIMRQLHPKAKNVVIYGSPGDPSHAANIKLVRRLAEQNRLPLDIEVREFNAIESCVFDASRLPADRLILMLGSMVSVTGEGINLQRANEIMSAAVNVPVYTAWDLAVGHGAVGGRVLSGKDQGRLAAQLALSVLGGENPENIPVMRNVGNMYMFDYKQLARFGIDRGSLPKDAQIINAPDYSYRIPRELFWTALFSFCLLAGTVVVLTINIRRRKRAEAALAASEEKFSKAFRNCADVVGIARLADGRYIEVSDAFFETFGYSRAEVMGRYSAAVGEENRPEGFRLWLSADERQSLFNIMKNEGEVKNLEVCWLTKDGQARVGLYSAEVISIGGEKCIVYVWHDITERKQAEEQLKKARDELEIKVEERTQELLSLNEELIAMNEELQAVNDELIKENNERRRVEEKLAAANRELTEAIRKITAMQNHLIQSEKMAALGNLVAGVAHEINTPLGVGLTAASHLKFLIYRLAEFCKQRLDQTAHEHLADIQEAADIVEKNLTRAAQLVRSFKQVSSDQASEAKRRFNVCQYLSEILTSMQPKLKKIKHVVEVDCDRHLEIDGYPGAFSQVITNLIMNSLVHAYEPGQEGNIRISVQKDKNGIILVYADDGKGMDEAVLSRIFDPFFTTKRGTGGTGLGLYILYNIVTRQFGGQIECNSKLGQGTTFRITFPAVKEERTYEM